jgi:uncharacterized membrane protein (DUF106 family)
MTLLNRLVASVLDVLFRPLEALPPVVSLALLSLLTAIAMLLIVGATSDQPRIVRVKRAIQATLFEIRLFNDDLPTVFRAQLEMLRHAATYLRLTMVPMLWMIVPLSLLLPHFDGRYRYTGLRPNQTALVTLALRRQPAETRSDTARPEPHVTLETPRGLRVDTPAVRLPALGEVVWNITPLAVGRYEMQIRVDDQAVTKSVQVSDRLVKRSPARTEPGIVNEVMNPSEAALPAESLVSAIRVQYPAREVHLFGWEVHWLVPYFLLSLVFAYALKRPFRVAL